MKKTGPLSVGVGLIGLLSVVLFGCNGLQRSQGSGYGASSPSNRSGWNKSSSVMSSTNSVPQSGPELSIRSRLRQAEGNLTLRKELDQYSKWLPWFRNDEEKLEFLSQNGFEFRQRWLVDNNMEGRVQRVTEDVKTLLEAKDIAVGMPDQFVKQSWGEPDLVEVSGKPEFRNYRWTYNRYVSTNDGYKQERKVVFVEGGKVVGWDTE